MKKLLASLITLGSVSAFGQDAQFSQIFNTPVLLNAAQTGLFDRSFRVSGAYRNTSFGEGMKAFSSGFVSVETRFTGSWVPTADRFGVGVYGYVDQSLGGALKSSYIGLSLAYNKSLAANGATRLGVGVQGLYTSRRLDASRVVFEDQFSSGGFSSDIASRDAVQGGSQSHLDLNAGLQLSHDATKWGLTLGASVNHVGRPRESFWGESYQLPMTYSGQGALTLKLKGGDKLNLQALYMSAAGQDYVQGGLIFSKAVHLSSTETTLDLGLLGRDTRALIPYLGLGWGRTKGALTYDVTTSKQKQGGLNRQSLEITLMHQF